MKFIASLSAHGDIVQLRLGPVPVYALTHPELVQSVLVNNARQFSRGRLFDKAVTVFGDALTTASGVSHRNQRRLIQPAFHRDRIAAYVKAMCDVAENTAESWQPGQVVAVDRVMTDFSLAVATRALFGSDIGDRAAAEFQRALLTIVGGTVMRTIIPDWCARLPTPGNRRFSQAIAQMDRIIGEAIRACDSRGSDHSAVLSILQELRADGHKITDRQVHQQAVGIAVAGTETTSAALAWVFYEIGSHPQIEKRIYAELNDVLSGRSPSHEDLSALAFTNRVITETLRLHAPWLIMRRARSAVEFGKTTVPAGTEIVYSPYIIHHDPRWFRDPERFDPDRWLPDQAKYVPKEAFIPFGAGVHKCIGDTFALAEMTIAVAVICQRWRLRPVPGFRVREVATAAVHPRRLPMIAEPRHATRLTSVEH